MKKGSFLQMKNARYSSAINFSSLANFFPRLTSHIDKAADNNKATIKAIEYGKPNPTGAPFKFSGLTHRM